MPSRKPGPIPATTRTKSSPSLRSRDAERTDRGTLKTADRVDRRRSQIAADEEAAFNGRSSRHPSATDAMRARLPRPGSGAPPLDFTALDRGDISDLIAARNAEEEAAALRKRQQAEREYQAFLASRRTGGRGRNLADDDTEIDTDIEADTEEDDRGDDDGTRPSDLTRPSDHLRQQAQATADTMAAATSARTGTTTATAPQLFVHPITEADADRLWDWIRRDPDRGQAFFGGVIPTTGAMSRYLAGLLTIEKSGRAVVRSLYIGDRHIGLTVLAPVFRVDRVAVMHLYLEASVRGALPAILRPLMVLAQQAAPNCRLAVMDAHPSWQKMLAPLGFLSHTMYIQGDSAASSPGR